MLLYASTSSRQSSLPPIGRKRLLLTLIHIAHCTTISISLRHHPTQLLSPLRTEKSLTPGKGVSQLSSTRVVQEVGCCGCGV